MSMKKSISIFLVILFVMVLFAGVAVVHADTYTVPCEVHGSHTLDDNFEKEVYMIKYDVMYWSVFNEYDDDDGISLEEVVQFNINGEFKNLWNLAQNIYNLLMPVGIVLAVIAVLCEMMTYVSSGNATADNLILYFIKMFVAMFIVLNGFTILTIIFEFCAIAYNAIAPEFGNFTHVNPVCFLDEVQDVFVWDLIMEYIGQLLAYLPIWFARLVIKIVTWSRVILCLVYAAFVPVGIHDMLSGGVTSSGVRYLKTLAAKVLQGAIIAGIYVGYKVVADAIRQASVGWLAGTSTSAILAIMFMVLVLASDRISEEIIG